MTLYVYEVRSERIFSGVYIFRLYGAFFDNFYACIGNYEQL